MDSNRFDELYAARVPPLPHSESDRWRASDDAADDAIDESAGAAGDAGAARAGDGHGDAHWRAPTGSGGGAGADDDAGAAFPGFAAAFGAPIVPTVPMPAAYGPPAPPQPQRPLLELRDVTVTYGQIAAVRDLSLTVGAGEIVALLGANGAGKTTTLRAISGLLRPRSGEISFDGRRIDRRSPEDIARLGLAHLPEGRGMFPRLTVSENLRMAAYGVGVGPLEYGKRLARALELFPVLGERMGQLAGTLSGGQQQMLAVGRALVTSPRLLMIDELSFGLAPGVVKQLFALLPRIAASGTAILLVEQFVGNALAVANRAYVLETGATTFAGPAAELAAREGFVESSYLGAGARRIDYERIRPAETEMLRVRVDPALVRRMRAVADDRTLPQLANEALNRYVAAREAARPDAPTAGAREDEDPVNGTGGMR